MGGVGGVGGEVGKAVWDHCRTYKIILCCVLFHSILTLRDYVLDLGHPYLWVQKLGGLHFPKEQPQVCTLIILLG